MDLFLEGANGLESPLSVLFSLDEGFKSYNNCTTKLPAQETRWTGNNGIISFYIRQILILKHGFANAFAV